MQGPVGCPHYLALPSLASPTSNIGRGENSCCLESAKNIMVAVCEHRHVFAADTTVEKTVLCCKICGLSHKKQTDIACPQHLPHLESPLAPHCPLGLTHIGLITTCVTSV